MKLPAKPPTKVDRVKAALCASGSLALLVDAQGMPETPCWRGLIENLAATLFGPDPVQMPSTETMAAHMDEFYAACIEEAVREYQDSLLMTSHPGFGVPTG